MQNQMNKYKCRNPHHQMGDIVWACLNKQCTEQRVCCHECKVEYHDDHPQKLVDFYLMCYYFEIQRNNLFLNLEVCSNELYQILEQLKEQIAQIRKEVHGGFINLKGLLTQNRKQYQQSFLYQKNKFYYNNFLKSILQVFNIQKNFCITNHEDKIDTDIQAIIESSLTQNEFHRLIQFQNQPIVLEEQNVQIAIISCDGTIIVSGSKNRKVQIWSAQTQIKLWEISEIKFGQFLTLSSNNTYLAIQINQNQKDNITIYNIKSHHKFWTFGEKIPARVYFSLSFSEDCQFLISIKKNKLNIWSLINKKNITTFQSMSNIVNVAISASNLLISCITWQSEHITVWNLQNKEKLIHQQILNQPNVKGLCFSKDSSMLITSCGKNVKIWKLTYSTLILTKTITYEAKLEAKFFRYDNVFSSVRLNTNETFIILMLRNKYLLIIELQTGKLIKIIIQLDAVEPQIKFERHLISKNLDRLIRIQDGCIKLWTRVQNI